MNIQFNTYIKWGAMLCLILPLLAYARPDSSLFEDIDLGPAGPDEDVAGLADFSHDASAHVDEKESAMELEELLNPGAKEAAEMREFKRKNAIYQIIHGTHVKKGEGYYFDARCQAAKDLGEFIDEKPVRDLLFEYGVIAGFVVNPKFVPTATQSFMKAGSNEMPRLLFYLTNAPTWAVRNTMAELLQPNQSWAPEIIGAALLDRLENDPSEDVRGPRARAMFEPYLANPFPKDVEEVARRRLRKEANTLVKYTLLWNHYDLMDQSQNNTGNLGLYRDLMFSGENWESRWLGMEVIRVQRANRDPKKFPEYERDALPDIIKVLQNDSSARTRFAAVDALYAFTNISATMALADAMEKDSDPDVRAYAARVLGVRVNRVNKYAWMIRYPERAEKFLAEKKAEAPDNASLVKITAAFGRALADKDPFVRQYAVIGLGKINTPESLKLLKGFPKDPEPWLNEEAARWIKQCENPDDSAFLGSTAGF